jgi:hypothetical protein
MKNKSPAVVVNAMTKEDIPRLGRKGPAVKCAKSNKQNAIKFLIMGQLAPVFIPVSNEPHNQLVWRGHSCPRCQFPFHILGQPQSVTANHVICDDFGRWADKSVPPHTGPLGRWYCMRKCAGK